MVSLSSHTSQSTRRPCHHYYQGSTSSRSLFAQPILIIAISLVVCVTVSFAVASPVQQEQGGGAGDASSVHRRGFNAYEDTSSTTTTTTADATTTTAAPPPTTTDSTVATPPSTTVAPESTTTLAVSTVAPATPTETTPAASTTTAPNTTQATSAPPPTNPSSTAAPIKKKPPATTNKLPKQIAKFSEPIGIDVDEAFAARDANTDPNSVDIVTAITLPSGTLKHVDLGALLGTRRIPNSYYRRNKVASPTDLRNSKIRASTTPAPPSSNKTTRISGMRSRTMERGNINDFIQPFTVTIDRLPGVAEVFTESDFEALLRDSNSQTEWLQKRAAAPRGSTLQRSGIQLYSGAPVDSSSAARRSNDEKMAALASSVPTGYLYSTAAQEHFYQTLRQRQYMAATSYGELTQEGLSASYTKSGSASSSARFVSSTKGSMLRWDQALLYSDTLARYPIYNYTTKIGKRTRKVPAMVPLPFYDVMDLTPVMPSLVRRITPSITRTASNTAPSVVTATSLTDPSGSDPTILDRFTLAAPIDYPYKRDTTTGAVEPTVLVDTVYYTIRSEEGGVEGPNGQLTLKGKLFIVMSPLAVENAPDLQFNVTSIGEIADGDTTITSRLRDRKGLSATRPPTTVGGLIGRASSRTRGINGNTATTTTSTIGFKLSRPYNSAIKYMALPNAPSDKSVLPSLFAVSTPLCRALSFSVQTDPLQGAARAVMGFTVPRVLASLVASKNSRRRSSSSYNEWDEWDEYDGTGETSSSSTVKHTIVPTYKVLNVVPATISSIYRSDLNPRRRGGGNTTTTTASPTSLTPQELLESPLPQVARRVMLYLVASDLLVDSIPISADTPAPIRVRVSIPTSSSSNTGESDASPSASISAITMFDSIAPSTTPWKLKIVHNGTQVLRTARSVFGRAKSDKQVLVGNLLEGRSGQRVQFGRVCPVTSLVAEVFSSTTPSTTTTTPNSLSMVTPASTPILKTIAITNRERNMPDAPKISQVLHILDLYPNARTSYYNNPTKYSPGKRIPTENVFIMGLVKGTTLIQRRSLSGGGGKSASSSSSSMPTPKRGMAIISLTGNPYPFTQSDVPVSDTTSVSVMMRGGERPLVSYAESLRAYKRGDVGFYSFADKRTFAPLTDHRYSISLSTAGRNVPELVSIKVPTTKLGIRQLECQHPASGASSLRLFTDASTPRQINPVIVGNTLSELSVSAEQASLEDVVEDGGSTSNKPASDAEVDYGLRWMRGSLFLQSFCPSADDATMLDGTSTGFKTSLSATNSRKKNALTNGTYSMSSSYVPPPLIKRPMQSIPRRFTVVVMQPPTYGTLTISRSAKGSRIRKEIISSGQIGHANQSLENPPLALSFTVPATIALNYETTKSSSIPPFILKRIAEFTSGVPVPVGDSTQDSHVLVSDVRGEGLIAEPRYTLGSGYLQLLQDTKATINGAERNNTQALLMNALYKKAENEMIATFDKQDDKIGQKALEMWRRNKQLLMKGDYFTVKVYETVELPRSSSDSAAAKASILVAQSSEQYVRIPFQFIGSETNVVCGPSEYGPLFIPPASTSSGSKGLSSSASSSSTSTNSWKGKQYNILTNRVVLNYTFPQGIERKNNLRYIGSYSVIKVFSNAGTTGDDEADPKNLIVSSNSRDSVFGSSYALKEGALGSLLQVNRQFTVGKNRVAGAGGNGGATKRVLSELRPGHIIVDDTYLDAEAGVGASLKYGLPVRATGMYLAQQLLGVRTLSFTNGPKSAKHPTGEFSIYPTKASRQTRALSQEAQTALGPDLLEALQTMAGWSKRSNKTAATDREKVLSAEGGGSTVVSKDGTTYYNIVLEDVFEYEVLGSSGGSPCKNTVKFTVRARNGGAVWSPPVAGGGGGNSTETRHREWIRYEQCRVDGWALLPFVDGLVENTRDPWRASIDTTTSTSTGATATSAPPPSPPRSSTTTITTRYAVVTKVPLLGRIYGVSPRTPFDPSVPLTYASSSGSARTPTTADATTTTTAPAKSMTSVFSKYLNLRRPKTENNADDVNYEYATSYCEVYACHLYTSQLSGFANGGRTVADLINNEDYKKEGGDVVGESISSTSVTDRSKRRAPLNSISSSPPLEIGDVIEELVLQGQSQPEAGKPSSDTKWLYSGKRLLYFYEAPRKPEYVQKQDTFTYKVITITKIINTESGDTLTVSQSVAYTTIHMALRRPKLREFRVTYRAQDVLMYNKANSAWHSVREDGEGVTTTGSTLVGIPITLGNPDKELIQIVTTSATTAPRDSALLLESASSSSSSSPSEKGAPSPPPAPSSADVRLRDIVAQFQRQEKSDKKAFSAWRHGSETPFTLFDYKRTRPQNVANALGLTQSQKDKLDADPNYFPGDAYLGKWDSGLYDPKTGREIKSSDAAVKAELLLPRSNLIMPTNPIGFSIIDNIGGAWVLDNMNKVILVPREPQALRAVDGSSAGGVVVNRQRYTFVVRIFTRSPTASNLAVSQSKVNGPIKIPTDSEGVLLNKVDAIAQSNPSTDNGTNPVVIPATTSTTTTPMANYFYYDARIILERASNTIPVWDADNTLEYSTVVGSSINLKPIIAIDMERDVLTYLIVKLPQYGDVYVNYYDASLQLAVRRKVEAGMRITNFVRDVNGAGATSKSAEFADSVELGTPNLKLTYVPYSPAYFAVLQSTNAAGTSSSSSTKNSAASKKKANTMVSNSEKNFFPREDTFNLIADDGSGDFSAEMVITITITGDPTLLGKATLFLKNTVSLTFNSSAIYLLIQVLLGLMVLVGGSIAGYYVYNRIYKPWRRAQRGLQSTTTATSNTNNHSSGGGGRGSGGARGGGDRKGGGAWQKMAAGGGDSAVVNIAPPDTMPENDDDEEMRPV